MASASDPVTIERAHFETLLRRANFVQNDFGQGFGQDLTVVAQADYDGLLLIARQYTNLRRNLVNGGVTEETITLLSQDETTQIPETQSKREDIEDGGARLNTSTNARSYHHNNGHVGSWSEFAPRSSHNGNHHSDWMEGDAGDDFSASYSMDGPNPDMANNGNINFPNGQVQEMQKPYYARMCKRTIILAGLADGTTHLDITSVVRGGLILEVYVRSNEHIALISFLREEDAVRFYDHVRRNDLYIRNKRIFIKWAERHFHLAGHVAGKISVGATRNLIIRRCDPNHTEESIRDDLEHIHNLVVIQVNFMGGSCYIKTNSVHNAMFARTCMMSRVKYKGSKIEWDLDECEQPLEVIPKHFPPKPHVQRMPSTKKPTVPMKNRFATLRLDDDDDDNSEDKFDSSSDFPAASTINVSA